VGPESPGRIPHHLRRHRLDHGHHTLNRIGGSWRFLVVALLTFGGGGGLVAPGPAELRDANTAMDARLLETRALASAVSRIQGRWAERALRGAPPLRCDDAEARSLTARSRALGAAWRDAVQSARVQLDRLETLWTAPTVAPLLAEADLHHADELRADVILATRRLAEAQAWQNRVVDPAMKGCAVAIEPAEGLPPTSPVAADEVGAPVAIFALGGGLVCPVGAPADGRVVVVPDGQACLGTADCFSCTPVDMLPAAVLGSGK
jgi:hypothetical protein